MATQLQAQTCSRCGNLSDNFTTLDSAMRVTLQKAGEKGPLPDQICASCFEQMSRGVSQGSRLRMEQGLREKQKMQVWKSRVHLIKEARNYMQQKAYSEAAVQYEKYLRVLEIVYNLKKNGLSPAVFNNSTRSKELTLITSVYWDLVRIYDTSPRYGDRMQNAARKLAEFLRFSPIYPDVLKKAQLFERSCRNPAVMKKFLRAARARRGPCFIATAAFADTPDANELILLRHFRDHQLRPYWLGRKIIWSYYRCSPPVARWIGRSPRKARAVRWIVRTALGALGSEY